ncbi:MAG TPA: PKD domain-containing protein, partial [Chitinophagaceae bacterium]|nr:PKD domain-containing protein [Chitinophagaceae bacterium]
SVYGADNDDARLVRIEYNGGNRAPQAVINAADTIGAGPLKVNFKGSNSVDFDEDDVLSYEWNFGDGSAAAHDADPEHTFNKNGMYHVTLTVTDPSGEKSTAAKNIEVGNTVPAVSLTVAGNSSFYFGGPVHYTAQAADKEDKTINAARLQVSARYIPAEAATYKVLSSLAPGAKEVSPAWALIQASDCKACHQVSAVSVGPAFMQVSKRYADSGTATVERLVKKVINGGSGNWGNHEMSAHPQLTPETVTTIVHYILSLSKQREQDSLPATGTASFAGAGKNGNYLLTASYTDGGNGVAPLTGYKTVVLRAPHIEAEDADRLYNIRRHDIGLGSIHNKSYFVLRGIDLAGIKSIAYRYSSQNIAATLEVHAGSAHGPVISTLNYSATGKWDNYRETSAPVKDPGGKNDLYFVFRKDTEPNHDMFSLDWLEFRE